MISSFIKSIKQFVLLGVKAKVGYDTETVKAKEKDYKALPSCCQYDRKK